MRTRILRNEPHKGGVGTAGFTASLALGTLVSYAASVRYGLRSSAGHRQFGGVAVVTCPLACRHHRFFDARPMNG